MNLKTRLVKSAAAVASAWLAASCVGCSDSNPKPKPRWDISQLDDAGNRLVTWSNAVDAIYFHGALQFVSRDGNMVVISGDFIAELR